MPLNDSSKQLVLLGLTWYLKPLYTNDIYIRNEHASICRQERNKEQDKER
jgi:hypothetical protein